MSLLHDLLQALRGHARKPGFAALMVLTVTGMYRAIGNPLRPSGLQSQSCATTVE